MCPHLWSGGGHIRWRGREWESPNPNEGTYTVVLYIYTLNGQFRQVTSNCSFTGLLVHFSAKRYGNNYLSFQMKFKRWVLAVYFNQNFNRIKGRKRAEISWRALYFMKAPHTEKFFEKSHCKKSLKVFADSKTNSNSQSLAQAWATSGPPPPAHPWFSKCRNRDGRTGRTGTKFCRSLITQILQSLRPTYSTLWGSCRINR